MKILVVHNHYQQPGGERVAVELLTNLLRQHGHQVVLYSQDSLAIRDYGMVEKARFFPRALFSLRSYRELTALALRERPDVAHVHNVFPLISPSAYVALGQAGIPIVQTLHNFRFMCPNGLLYTQGAICERCKNGNTTHAVRFRCFRGSYALSALYALAIGLHRRAGTFERIYRYIALTPFAAAKLSESGLATSDNVSVLGNFLPDPLPSAGARARQPYVVYVGRLSSEKGVATLVEAAPRLPELTVRILGDGPEAPSLRQLVREQGLANVELLGHVDGPAKWEAMRNALAVVVPSRWYEHFPFVVLEAMAVGTPIVASRLGSLSSLIVPGENGLLFRAGDSSDLAQTLRSLVAWPASADAMGERARQRVEQHFTAAHQHTQLLEIYRLAALRRAALQRGPNTR